MASSKRPSGRGGYCRPSLNAPSRTGHVKRTKKRYDRDVEPAREVPEGHRFCADCGTVEPVADFPRNRSDSSGCATYGTPCHDQRPERPSSALCGDPDPEHVDHDHRTGWVRGILCFNCNGGLGRFRDSPARRARAITYLRGTTWQWVLIHPGVYQMCSPMRGRPPSRRS
ncbi:endonuclease VII domain-containing protein [Micromonospora sp. MS34]|uniref:endonuclease VII domain-containing protein n=1 Tax=Micromonospora sp. MS34 TaxID=3385971 RepID=UPI0039A20AAA